MRLNGFHIEPTNRCVLKCSACERTRFQEQFGTQHWHNRDLDIDALIKFMDMDVTGFDWELCGNTGDPIYHPELPRLVKWIKSQQGRIWMTTNGSYQKAEWWSDLLSHMDCHDVIWFSVDGLPATSPQYRVNSDWASIERAIQQAVASGVQVIWKMIPFSFNEHEIDAVRELSASMGMGFRLDPSDRFTTDDPLRPQRIELHRTHGTGSIDPVCAQGNRHYISSAGQYTSCCWASAYDFYYKSRFHKNSDDYNISKTTLSQVMQHMTGFDQQMRIDPMPVCQYICRKL